MGEARRRQAAPPTVVYHHTSTLRTNLLWMSGIIALEGSDSMVPHPLLGKVGSGLGYRRACRDFPALAWFTSQIAIPQCLLKAEVRTEGRQDVLPGQGSGDRQAFLNGIALNRVALGFPIAGSIVPWPDHPGYGTQEGHELNRTAREAGDNPNHWYVSDVPVDILLATEVWLSSSIFTPKLRRAPTYLGDVHRMVQLCRDIPGSYIPPTWLGDPTVEEMMRQAGKSPAALMKQVLQQAGS